MDVKSIKDILAIVNKSDLTEVEIEQKDFRIKIKKKSSEESVVYAGIPMQAQPLQAMPQQIATQQIAQPTAQPAAQPAAGNEGAASDANLFTFKSPMIGTFYRSPGPDKDSFVNVGDSISPGKVLCIIEAMKLFNEIESEISGKVVKILVDDATPVEYDQPLFLIER